MEPVSFLTGNAGKFAIAKRIFSQYQIPLIQEKTDFPEIQSLDVVEVAAYAALAAEKALGKAVFKSDVGYYFEALNGFPGTLIKFINQSLSADDLLRLMQGQKNRMVIIRECLAYKAPGQKVVTFSHEYKARIGETPSGQGSPANQVIMIEGFNKTIGCMTDIELQDFLAQQLTPYHELAKFICDQMPAL